MSLFYQPRPLTILTEKSCNHQILHSKCYKYNINATRNFQHIKYYEQSCPHLWHYLTAAIFSNVSEWQCICANWLTCKPVIHESKCTATILHKLPIPSKRPRITLKFPMHDIWILCRPPPPPYTKGCGFLCILGLVWLIPSVAQLKWNITWYMRGPFVLYWTTYYMD